MDVVDAAAERMVTEERREMRADAGRAVFFAALAGLAWWAALHPEVLAGTDPVVVIPALWVLVGAAGLETVQALDMAAHSVRRVWRWRRDPLRLRRDAAVERAVERAAEQAAARIDRDGGWS